ncbi:threalose-6-phosphate phosphatase [Pichia californica]|nr:threalose-6-phosphate phosphatase [[Candida] californica]
MSQYPEHPWPGPKNFSSELNLSGRIINCMTQLPNAITKTSDGNFKISQLRGSSALYSSNKFLADETEWETHLVAWTGEINSPRINISTKVEDLTNSNKNNHNLHSNGINDKEIYDGDPLYLNEDHKDSITKLIRDTNKNENIHPVWLLRRDQDRWRKYAENVLWPVFHYMMNEPNDGREEIEWWHDYVKFNEAYAAKVKEIAKPGDVIWIHDYYLLLLPQILRMELPNVYICHFLHIPFPSSEYFRCLSKRKILLDGMLGANQLGFQSYSFARHFISCCSRVNGYETTPNKVTVHSFTSNIVTLPLGIDIKSLEHDAFTDEIENKVKTLKELNQNRKIIIGRDRLDSVRGVVEKLQAFELFLDIYPEWIGKVVLIQVSFKPYYHSSKLEKKVNELISNINRKYSSLDYSPVLHYNMRINKAEYLALLRVADLCLITSIRDGMNTTALEYIVCQKLKCSPLILSEFSGTTTVLQDSIQVNPWDSVGVANAINESLVLSDEKKSSIENNLYNAVCQNTNQDWSCKVISNLLEFMSTQTSINGTPYLNRPVLLKNYQESKRRLFLFDYDGTLTPIVRDPNAAIPSARLNNLLEGLTKDPLNEIWVISGRDQEFLEKWIGSNYPQIGLSAEHGCFMKKAGGEKWVNLAESFDMSWQQVVEEVFSKYTDKTPGTFIERKKVALTWHYRKADPVLGLYQAEKCKEELVSQLHDKYDVEVMSGKANLEVRPKFVNKGEIVRRLVLCSDAIKQTLKPKAELPDFVLCLGDDTTDEDMFRALNSIESQWKIENRATTNSFDTYGFYPVTVGPSNKVTVAKAYLTDPYQVLDTIGLLLGKVSLFETAGTVELDDRGHLKNSESALTSQANRAEYIRESK